MIGTRYIDGIVTSRATVTGDIVLSGSILNEDGDYSSANSIGNVHGNVSIGEVGNITHIDNVDAITGNIGNIGTIENATNITTEHVDHIESIEASSMSVESITTSESMVGNINVNSISTVKEANNINDVATITTMEEVATIMSVSKIEDIDNTGTISSVDSIGNVGQVTNMEASKVGNVTTIMEANVANIINVGTITEANNVGTIENIDNMTTVISVGDIDKMESGEIDIVGSIESASDVNITRVGKVMEANNVGTITTANIGSVNDISSVEGTVDIGSVANANITATDPASTISIKDVDGGTLDITGNVEIDTYSGNISNASGVYIMQGMEEGYPLAVTGDAKITGNLDVDGSGTFLGRLDISSNADVPLHVTTSHDDHPLITFENTDTGNIGLRLKNTDQWFDIEAHKPTGLQFRADGDTRMTMLTDGNLGIGTVAPEAKLHVDGDAIIRGNLGTDGSITTTDMTVSMNTDATLHMISADGGTINSSWDISSKHDGSLEFLDRTGSSPTQRLTITGTGRVDVNGNLDVGGTTRLRGTVTTDDHMIVSETLVVDAGNNESASVNVCNRNSDGIVTNHWGMIASSDGSLEFQDHTYTPSTTRMAITGDGDVGIGTTEPEAKLDVDGNIRSTGNLDVGDAIVRGNLDVGGNIISSQNIYVTSNVGIGTTSPTAKLDVHGTARIRGATTIDDAITTMKINVLNGTTTVPAIATISYFSGTGNNNERVVIDNIGGNAALRLRSIDANGDINADFGLAVNSNGTAGIYKYTDDTTGSYALLINDTGNVGIGTTSPTAKLDVDGNIRSTGNLDVIGSINVTSNLDVNGNINSGKNLYVTGNVGIGTTSPTAKLDVDGTTRLRGDVTMDSNLTVNGQIHSNLGLSATSNTDTPLRLESTGGNGSNWGIVARTDGRLQFYDFSNTADNSDVMVLTNTGRVGINQFGPSYELDVNGNINSRKNLYVTGNVGIGTTSPTAKLDVDGTTRLRGVVTTDDHMTVNKTLLINNDDNTSARVNVRNLNGGTATSYWGMIANTNGALEFRDYTLSTTRMAITGDGNLGIGTSTPEAKLDVDGNIKVTGNVIVNGFTSVSESDPIIDVSSLPHKAKCNFWVVSSDETVLVLSNTSSISTVVIFGRFITVDGATIYSIGQFAGRISGGQGHALSMVTYDGSGERGVYTRAFIVDKIGDNNHVIKWNYSDYENRVSYIDLDIIVWKPP